MKLMTSLVLLVVLGCGDVGIVRREKQLKTYWSLYEVSRALQAETAFPSENRLSRAVQEGFPDGRDFWGNELHILLTPDASSYAIISYGKDGIPDMEPQEYFTVSPHDVHGQLDNDLILRDGQMISRAGK